MLRRTASSILFVARIATARIEQRAQAVACTSARRRDDPRAVEERIADRKCGALADIEIRRWARERVAVCIRNCRIAARIRLEKLLGRRCGWRLAAAEQDNRERRGEPMLSDPAMRNHWTIRERLQSPRPCRSDKKI